MSKTLAVLLCWLVAGSMQRQLFSPSVGQHALGVFVLLPCTLGACDAHMQPCLTEDTWGCTCGWLLQQRQCLAVVTELPMVALELTGDGHDSRTLLGNGAVYEQDDCSASSFACGWFIAGQLLFLFLSLLVTVPCLCMWIMACTLGASDAPMRPIVLKMRRDAPVVGCCSSGSAWQL